MTLESPRFLPASLSPIPRGGASSPAVAIEIYSEKAHREAVSKNNPAGFRFQPYGARMQVEDTVFLSLMDSESGFRLGLVTRSERCAPPDGEQRACIAPLHASSFNPPLFNFDNNKEIACEETVSLSAGTVQLFSARAQFMRGAQHSARAPEVLRCTPKAVGSLDHVVLSYAKAAPPPLKMRVPAEVALFSPRPSFNPNAVRQCNEPNRALGGAPSRVASITGSSILSNTTFDSLEPLRLPRGYKVKKTWECLPPPQLPPSVAATPLLEALRTPEPRDKRRRCFFTPQSATVLAPVQQRLFPLPERRRRRMGASLARLLDAPSSPARAVGPLAPDEQITI